MIKKITLICFLLFTKCASVYATNISENSKVYLSAGAVNCLSIESAKRINDLFVNFISFDKKTLRSLDCKMNWGVVSAIIIAKDENFVYVVYKTHNDEISYGWIDKRFLVTIA